MIQIRFGDNFIYLETNKLIPSKELLGDAANLLI